jgi:hypothetical protein
LDLLADEPKKVMETFAAMSLGFRAPLRPVLVRSSVRKFLDTESG